MPCVHEFWVIHDFNNQKENIDYEPPKYNCVSIDDDIIHCLWEQLSVMKIYFHSFKRPEYGLVTYGVTMIPPTLLALFCELVTTSRCFVKSIELKKWL